MKSTKVLLISAEISALICLFLLLFFSAQSYFDYTRAAFACMFAVVAVMLQSMQQDIKWSEPKQHEPNEMQRDIDDCKMLVERQAQILREMSEMLNK